MMSGSEKVQQARYLILREENRDGYYHLRGRIVTDRYESGSRFPYGLDDTYGDGHLWSGLETYCQGDAQSASRDRDAVYGFSAEYRDVYTVDVRKARRMIKTLEKIERSLNKLSEARGYVQNYGDYCGRVAEALGCQGMIFERSTQDRQYSDYRYD